MKSPTKNTSAFTVCGVNFGDMYSFLISEIGKGKEEIGGSLEMSTRMLYSAIAEP